jgi:LytTr DNA-binding domain
MPAELHEPTPWLHERPRSAFETDRWSASLGKNAAQEQVDLSDPPQHSSLAHLVAQVDPRNSWTGYLIAAGTILSVGLALSEPSASRGLDFPARVVFWLAHVASALFLFELAQITLGRISTFARLPPLVLVVAVGVVGAILFALFNLLLLDRLPFMVGDGLEIEPTSLHGMANELRDSGAVSVLFWVLLNSPRLFMIARQKDADGTSDTSAGDVMPAQPDTASPPLAAGSPLLELLSRLPRSIGSDIVAISAELHYLRVYTRSGEALILMSFGRAVEALAVIPGQAIHRSHWVALAHVVAVQSVGDRVICQLDTGLKLPVSRTYRARLRADLAGRDIERARQAAERLERATVSDAHMIGGAAPAEAGRRGRTGN